MSSPQTHKAVHCGAAGSPSRLVGIPGVGEATCREYYLLKYLGRYLSRYCTEDTGTYGVLQVVLQSLL